MTLQAAEKGGSVASVNIIAPTDDARVSGRVVVRARVSGGTSVSNVRIVIGPPEYGTRPTTGAGNREYTYAWDTTRKLVDGVTATPSDSIFWITAYAIVDGVQLKAPYIAVFTANRPVSALRSASGWRPELAWAANYSGSLATWKASQFATIGSAYATVGDDPVLGAARRVLKVSVPESAKYDADQPTSSTVRFQSSSPRVLRDGDEFCVGFAFLPSADFPTVYPPDDPANPAGPAGTSYIALFQFYGPPYTRGSPFLLQANRNTPADPLDEFVVKANELNAGDPWPFLSLPYRRGRWTDVVFRIRLSSSIEEGWIETYVNQGASTTVQPQPFVNGRLRVPRVLLRADSEAARTDMQIYRVVNRFERVTVWHTGHRIAATVAEADPRSYRFGAKP
jgi:hypothetical protein